MNFIGFGFLAFSSFFFVGAISAMINSIDEKRPKKLKNIILAGILFQYALKFGLLGWEMIRF